MIIFSCPVTFDAAKMAKAILEVDGKALLAKHFKSLISGCGAGRNLVLPSRSAPVKPDTDLDILVGDYPWLQTEVRGAGLPLFAARQ